MSNTTNNQENGSTFMAFVKIAVGLFLLFVGSQGLFAQTSEQTIQMYDLKIGYSKVNIEFGGKYKPGVYTLQSFDQSIYLTPEALVKLGEGIKNAIVKAKEWNDLAIANGVDNMEKVMPINGYFTTGGMIYDHGFKGTGSSEFEFKFRKEYKEGNWDVAKVFISVWQSESVYSNWFYFPTIDTNKTSDLESLTEFLTFIDNSSNLLKEKLGEKKEHLFQ